MDAQIAFYTIWNPIWYTSRWDSFGEKKYNKRVSKAKKRHNKHKDKFNEVGAFYGNHFSRAINRKGKEIIVNWLDPVYLFSSRPSTTFRFARPYAYALERSIYEVAKLAVRFLPWGFVGTIVDPLLNARYKSQIPHEADLYAQLEGGDMGINKKLLRQSINPFIMLTAKSPGLRAYEGAKINLLGF